jgi:hypothetical protein
MKSLFLLLAFLVSTTPAFAARSLIEVQECKDNRGTVLTTSMDSLSSVMRSRADRPQVYVSGVVVQIQPEDHSGLPHQKYTIRVNNQVTLLIVSNLDFGRVPLTVGATLSVCGEFKRVGQGMVHWTHFDPHGSHPDGFTIVDGKLYGDQENSYQNR